MVITLLTFSLLTPLLYLVSGLLSAIGIHFGWNVMQYHVFSLQPRFKGLLDIKYTSKSIIAGGTLGQEAGLLGVAVLVGGIVLILMIRSQYKNQFIKINQNKY